MRRNKRKRKVRRERIKDNKKMIIGKIIKKRNKSIKNRTN